MTKDEEKRLIRKFKAGNESVFERLWLGRCEPVIQYTYAMLLGKDVEVDRALGIIRMKYFTALRSEQLIINSPAWLKKVTYNVCIDILRQLTKKRVFLENKAHAFADPDKLPDGNNDTEAKWQLFYSVLGTYSAPERFVIVAFYVGDWKAKKIADICECPVKEVHNLMTRFRNAIRKKLGQQ